jgi:hypothetical protein
MMARPVRLPRSNFVGMIDVDSIAGLRERQHELHPCCCRCDRWYVIDLERMVRDGYGTLRLPRTARRQKCGEVGQPQVRPPRAVRSSTAWIAAPVQ